MRMHAFSKGFVHRLSHPLLTVRTMRSLCLRARQRDHHRQNENHNYPSSTQPISS